MIDASFLIIKKHIKSNCKNLLINFFALFLSLFALIVTTNAILLKDEFNNSIINSYPNKDVYKISKIGSLDFDNDYNIVQKTRPTIEEVLSIDSLKINYIDIDLSYLLDTYTLKVDGLIKNESIIFEPHFLNDDIFYYQELNLGNFSIHFEKEFLFKLEEETQYETFKWDVDYTYKFEQIKVFNFLSFPTIYYPYTLLKNAAESTFFSSKAQNLYSILKEKSGNEIETNYALVCDFDSENVQIFNESKYSELYELSNTPREISKNFMAIFSTILDFCFYFLIVIFVLVIILLIYTFHFIILKNHKETALIRTYGMSKRSINFMYCFEIILLFLISFGVALCTALLSFFLINKCFIPTLNLNFSISINEVLTLLIGVISMLMVIGIAQIPLIKINKINIRKELNSI